MTITWPVNATELEEMLLDNKVRSEIFATEESTREFQTRYAMASNKANPDINQEIIASSQKAVADMVKEMGLKSGDKNVLQLLSPLNAKRVLGTGKGVTYNKRAPGAAIDNANLFGGDYVKMIQSLTPQARRGQVKVDEATKADIDKLLDIQNSYGSIVPADGGFLIPESLRSGLAMVALEQSVVRPRATVIPMETPRVGVPFVDSTTNSGSVFGGFIFYWAEEGAQLTEAQSKFGQVVLDANKLTGFAGVPNELIADASAFGAFLDQMLPKGLAFTEDYAFFNGTGVGQPKAIISNNATVTVSAVAGQGANTVTWDNVVSMYSRMFPASLGNAEWYVAPDVFPQLATMAVSVGTGGAPVWIMDGTGAPRLYLLGRPVNISEKCAPLGTTGDIIFADLSYYLVGDRQTWHVDTSEHYLFQNDKTAVRIIERVDGRPWIQSAITPANGSSNTLTAFVQLSSTRT
jgi:HK97 family phage major capsid protein